MTTCDRPRPRAAGWTATLMVVLAACGGAGGSAGDRLPDAELIPLDGGEAISLADIEGPAVVNLWATWCTPCRKEIPDFEEVHQARGDVVRFVGVNIGEAPDDAAPFLDEVGATYDQYLDPKGFAQTGLEAVSLPTTVVIDAEGRITERRVGPMDQDDLNDAIDVALGG